MRASGMLPLSFHIGDLGRALSTLPAHGCGQRRQGEGFAIYNFILFNPDEWRGDLLGCAGHPVVQTPHTDRLAAQGTRFEQCHTQHTVCTPSRAAFLTGRPVHVRGHRTLWHTLQPDEPNLLRSLHKHGYDVRMYGKNDVLSPESFIDSVNEAGTTLHGHGAGMVNPWSPDDPRRFSFLLSARGDATSTPDYADVQKGIAFLRQAHDRPFCLFLPLLFPHPPYAAPQPFHDMYDPATLPPLRPVVTEGKPRFYAGIRASRRLPEVDDAHMRKIHAVYLGMVSYSDWLLGELLKALDETGLASNTVVIVFSDHGDWAGDYGLVEKWPSGLDDTLTRVPFVVRMPGGAPGHVVDNVTELLDLVPTVLDLAGITPDFTQFGRSLVPQLQGAAGDPDRAAFAEGGYDPNEPHCFEGHVGGDQFLRDPSHIYYPKANLQQTDPRSVCRSTMIRTRTHKLVRRPLDVSELYDLQADPLELHNHYNDSNMAGVRADLESRLLDWYIHTSDAVPLHEDPRGYTKSWMGSLHPDA